VEVDEGDRIVPLRAWVVSICYFVIVVGGNDHSPTIGTGVFTVIHQPVYDALLAKDMTARTRDADRVCVCLAANGALTVDCSEKSRDVVRVEWFCHCSMSKSR